MIKILYIGDVVGQPGRRALHQKLESVVDRERIDFTIVNIENAAGGFGVTEAIMEELSERPINAYTSGNQAMGRYLDGRVSAVLGTHTHVPTADERILPNGTAFQTDVGMTGAYDSVIGFRPDEALHRFLMNTPRKLEVAKRDIRLTGAMFEIDETTGLAHSITRVQERVGD